MGTFIVRFVAILAIASGAAAWGTDLRPPGEALRQGEVLALVAGGALPENIVYEIKARGLGFHVSDEYRSQLKLAGAETQLLAALDSAKAVAESTEETQHAEVLQHMAQAADLMRQKCYTDAVKELTVALALSPDSSEVGFVMGELLR